MEREELELVRHSMNEGSWIEMWDQERFCFKAREITAYILGELT